MEYYTTMRIEFNDVDSAKMSEECIMHSLDNVDARSFGYSERVNFGEILRQGIAYDGDKAFLIDEEAGCGIATPEDMLNLLPEMVKSIATQHKEVPFHIISFNSGTYSDSKAEIEYCDNKILMETVYYPEGDYENMLCCPECDEEIVSVNDYEKGKTYICPECGEECDLDDEYEDACPVVEKQIIEL